MDAEQPTSEPQTAAGQAEIQPVSRSTWFSRFTSVVFVVFCFEIGLFLLIYPWTDAWTDNTISLLARGQYQLPWRQLWNDPYFRGAVSGIGIVNLVIALQELFGLFRNQSPS